MDGQIIKERDLDLVRYLRGFSLFVCMWVAVVCLFSGFLGGGRRGPMGLGFEWVDRGMYISGWDLDGRGCVMVMMSMYVCLHFFCAYWLDGWVGWVGRLGKGDLGGRMGWE